MPTIIDSLFLELGVDVSKFSADQQKALAKIAEFEKQTKRAAAGAKGGIKTVGDAFRDLAKESRIGSSADRLDNLAAKFKQLGISMETAGGAGTPFGAMAKGLGMMLSPATLGAAAIGMLGKEAWDFNEIQTKVNATMARNVELSGMAADNYWAMGQAAQTTGGDPAAVQAGIDSLQTTLAGAAIGIGSAQAQMTGMARLSPYGAHYNPGGFGQGANEESLFKSIRNYERQHGRAQALALWLGSGFGSQDQFDLAVSKGGWEEYKKAQALAKKIKSPGGLKGIMEESMKSQVGLGEKDIQSAFNAEQAYGGMQKPMQTIVGLVTNILAVLGSMLGYIAQLVDFFTGGKAAEAAAAAADTVKTYANKVFPGMFAAQSPVDLKQKQAMAMAKLMQGGESSSNAAAIVGNLMQESHLDPLATSDDGAHLGIAQWDKSRQAAFAKQFRYQMGSDKVSAVKQRFDQFQFLLTELKTTQRATQRAMDSAHNLGNKTWAFEQGYERPGDNSFFKRFGFSQEALQASLAMVAAATAPTSSRTINNSFKNDTNIGGITINTHSTDPKAHAAAISQHISKNPLISPIAQQQVALSTGSMVQ